MQDKTVHPMSRAFVWQSGVSGAVCLAASVGILLWLVRSPPEAADERIGYGALAVVVAAVGAWCVRLVLWRDGFTVVVDHDGLRIGDGEWIPWTAVARLRHRQFLQRVDLIGHSGASLGAIEYQVKDSGALITRVATHGPMPVPGASRQRFGRRADPVGLATTVVVLAGAACCLVAWSVLSVAWFGVGALLLAAVALHLGVGKRGAAIELTSAELLLQGTFQETRIPRTSIVGTDLVFERIRTDAFNEILRPSVTVTLRDGTSIPILPLTDDAFEVHDALRSWLCVGLGVR